MEEGVSVMFSPAPCFGEALSDVIARAEEEFRKRHPTFTEYLYTGNTQTHYTCTQVMHTHTKYLYVPHTHILFALSMYQAGSQLDSKALLVM